MKRTILHLVGIWFGSGAVSGLVVWLLSLLPPLPPGERPGDRIPPQKLPIIEKPNKGN